MVSKYDSVNLSIYKYYLEIACFVWDLNFKLFGVRGRNIWYKIESLTHRLKWAYIVSIYVFIISTAYI